MEKFEKEPKIKEEKVEEETKERATIVGFEKFDCSNKFTGEKVKGEEILEKAAEVLPTGLYWENMRKIEYKDEVMPMESKYGFGGFSAVKYNETEKRITFYKIPDWKRQDYLFVLRGLLAHDWAHSIDPEALEQKDLSEHERYEMLIEWRRVRREEPPFSSYVKEIKNKNKRVEESLKRDEDFAESMMFVLAQPRYVREIAPKRYEFCVFWLKKRFPEFDIDKIAEKKEKYFSFLENLE